MNTLLSSIAEARDHSGIALLPFVPAGFPSLAATIETLKALDLPGIGAIEVGIPFSDPVADGPTIQAAFSEALAAGFRVTDLFDAVRAARHEIAKPLVAMVSFSIVYRYGVDRFLSDAKAAGFSGLLFPDLPPPEAAPVCQAIASAGLESVLLVAPTTTERRRAEIARLCTGFVYYLSVAGITGERDRLPADLEGNVRLLKGVCGVPICVGFGIGTRAHLQQLQGTSDGAIVGSALVRHMQSHREASPSQVAQRVRAYCQTLLGGA